MSYEGFFTKLFHNVVESIFLSKILSSRLADIGVRAIVSTHALTVARMATLKRTHDNNLRKKTITGRNILRNRNVTILHGNGRAQ